MQGANNSGSNVYGSNNSGSNIIGDGNSGSNVVSSLRAAGRWRGGSCLAC